MSDRHDDLFDESVLRRALRLEPDEGSPRFDPRTIALMARQPVAPTLRQATFALGAAVVVGFAAGNIWSAIFSAGPSIADGAMSAIVDAAVAIASVLLPIADLVQQPVIPLSLLAALCVAILYELRERRERAHANAS
jgi:hypothetical protein